MDWIVFGDDWGVHPSTEQHLILNLPPEDRVIWVDSIGMRQPTLNITDVNRFLGKAVMMFRASEDSSSALYLGTLGGFVRVKPKVIPWHLRKAAISFNNRSLSLSIDRAMRALSIVDPVLLSSTPVVAQYLTAIPHRKIIYLRQDDYERYPGCDPELVRKTEPIMFVCSDVIFVTARSLHPGKDHERKTHYLPQGVQFKHFSQVSLHPARKKILGFFGTIDERINFQLVKEVAQSASDWQLEFIGEISYKPSWIDSVPNINFKPVVPFRELPGCLSEWSVAWIPYIVNDVTRGINPLKVREYLAAGLASQCTPLPEAQNLSTQVMISDKAHEIVNWINEELSIDSYEARTARRESMSHLDWAERSIEFRNIIHEADAVG